MIWLLLFLSSSVRLQPDYWCPMHLDVRSTTPGKCPICAMDLVPIPPRRLGEYRTDVSAIGSRRATGLRVQITDPDGKPVTGLAIVHERPLHLFIIGRRLDFFAHVHPQASRSVKGRFEVAQELPPGEYVAIADFLPAGGEPQMVHRAFVTPGYNGPLMAQPPELARGPSEVVVDGVRVAIDAHDLRPRRERVIRFTLSDAVTGAPIADLEPYLGAPAHLLIVNAALTDAIHAHPEQVTNATAAIEFRPLMPVEGSYKLWVQFQRAGKVSTAAFVVNIQ
jgi:heavy metal-binding protein